MCTTAGNKFPVENELLLLGARSQLNETLSRHLKQLAENAELDWEAVLQSGVQHRILPLLFKSLKTSCPDLVPGNIIQQLQTIFRNNTAHNLLFAATLLKILAVFSENDIQAVPFKGPILTASVYGDLSLRSFGDLDILIRHHDMECAVRLLLEHGYKTYYDLPLEKYLLLVDKQHHANLSNLNNGIAIELHWEMSGRYCSHVMDYDFVRPRLETVSLLDQQIMNLGPEDLLVYLCTHGNRHRWMQLDTVCCIAELLRECPRIDWDLILEIAGELRVKRMLLMGLILARDLLGTILPPTILISIDKEQALPPLTTQIKAELLDSKAEQQEVVHHLGGLLFHYRTMDHLSDGIRWSIRKFCTPDIYDLEWVSLPTFLWFLYPILRPLRFATKYVRQRKQK